MSAMQKIVVFGLLILLGATGYGWWHTNQPVRAAAKPGKTLRAEDTATGVDENTFALARRLTSLADGPEEQQLADSAQRLAEHELAVAFAAALRQLEAHPPVLSPQAQAIQVRLQKSQKLLEADQANVTQLTAAVAQANDAQKNSLQDQLDLASTQLELDKDEVEEANQDLLQAGGNEHQRIQMMMQEHSAAEKIHPPQPTTPAATAPQGLVHRIQQWNALRRKQEWLVYAGAQAAANAARLSADRQKLAEQLEATKAGVPELAHHTKGARTTGAVAPAAINSSPGATAAHSPPAPGQAPDPTRATTPGATSATAQARPNATPQAAVPGASAAAPATNLLTTTRQISADQRILTLLDQRISDLNQLAAAYRNWDAATSTETASVLHGMLQSALIVIAIILILLFVDRWLENLLGRTKLDRRQVETLRSVTRVALQIVGVLIILLIVFGMPSQLGTMIGLAGAGLTVALKDFIVAFIGWLVLMGRNGLRLGDWVEIRGVSGEVVELNMFHTVLLETGNWTDSGHPTGRRVTFTNSFAIEGHYFNFSTTGQWLWDELIVLVPFDKDPNLIAEAINKEVVAATAASAAQAEQEWRRTAPGRRGSVFSATPGISVKPAVGGIEIAVRYITRASERFQLRSKLFQSAVHLLGINSQAPGLPGRVESAGAAAPAPAR
jgi:small-conductance mechanosensitive channel